MVLLMVMNRDVVVYDGLFIIVVLSLFQSRRVYEEDVDGEVDDDDDVDGDGGMRAVAVADRLSRASAKRRMQRELEEAVVPASAGEGCRFWRLPRSRLAGLRAGWAREEEAGRLEVLRKVPVFHALLLPELQAVAALSEEKRVAPGEVGAGKEAVVELGD